MEQNPSHSNPPLLRLMTYMAPSIPVEYYELLAQYLAEKLSCRTYLIYESRWSGPPADKPDPFTLGDVDIGFLCTPSFPRLYLNENADVDLIRAAPIFNHARTPDTPVFYSDVIIHADHIKKYKDFEAMRGCKWAYNDPESLSGSIITLKQLKKMGSNANFFGHLLQSGSHLKSIEMVLNKDIDGAAIDSTVLALQMRRNPELKSKLHILTSWGPLPIQPIICRKSLSENLKQSISTHLLEMHKDPAWAARLQEFNVTKFTSTSVDMYNEEDEIKKEVKGMSINQQVYY